MIKFNLKELLAQKGFKEKRNVSLHEVAKETGIGLTTLSRIANSRGESHTSTLQVEKLCRYFKCSLDDFMTLIPDPVTGEGGEEKAE